MSEETATPNDGMRAEAAPENRVRLATPPAPQGSAGAAAAGAPAAASGAATVAATGATAAPGGPMRVLYVEDNRVNQILFEETIRLHGGIDLRLAENGAEALALVEQWRPEALVLDAHLPGMNGYELLLQLRGRPGLANTPAFMCSADALPEDMERGRRAGFVGYWTKPIDIARVMNDLDALRAARAR
jgi:CheY-like chemotaxis protein